MYCNLKFSRRRPVPQLLLPWSMSISSVPTVPSELGLRGTGIILPRLIDWFWEYRVFHKCIFLFNWLIVVVTFLLFYRKEMDYHCIEKPYILFLVQYWANFSWLFKIGLIFVNFVILWTAKASEPKFISKNVQSKSCSE